MTDPFMELVRLSQDVLEAERQKVFTAILDLPEDYEPDGKGVLCKWDDTARKWEFFRWNEQTQKHDRKVIC